ncbi:unnamed protein product [Calicophoron daubneyi]|uniref:Receptor expression-enhancing protein n=1 Tax=Calicophoron daubneyi TaxID=300641 RepID=A0AAV2U096_CALDB
MEKIRSCRNELDKKLHEKNFFTDMLDKVEKKTKIPRVNFVLGFAGVLAIYLMFGWGSSFIATFIGFVYPAYRSMKALETFDKEDDTHWLTYWTVFASVSVIEAFTDLFFYWIPLYSFFKCALFVFMMWPGHNNGSQLLYQHVLRPYVLKQEKKIDSVLDAAADLAGDFSNAAKKRAAEVVAGVKQD